MGRQTTNTDKSSSTPAKTSSQQAPTQQPNMAMGMEAQMLQLQQMVGNQAVSQMIQRTTAPVVQRTMMDPSVEEDVFDAAEGKRYAELSNLSLSMKQRGPMDQDSRSKLEGVFAPRAAAATQEKERYEELGRVENRVEKRGPMGAKKKANLEATVGAKAQVGKDNVDPSTYDPVEAFKLKEEDKQKRNEKRTTDKRERREKGRKDDDDTRAAGLSEWNTKVGDEYSAKKTRLRDRMKHLKETKKLDKMAAIFTKGLAAKKQKAEDDIAGDLWMSAEESVEALEKKASELEEWYKPFSRMRKRLIDLKARVAGKPAEPEVTQVETELNDGLAAKSMPASLKSLFAQVSNKLNPLEANQLKEEFDTAKSLGDTEASDAMEDMIDDKRIWIEQLTKTYKTSYDSVSQGEFSAEFPVRGLKGIVIHTHMTASGTPKSGNGTHWKSKSGKKDKGGTHEVSEKVRTGLVTSDWGQKAVESWAKNPENPKRKK